VVLRCAADRRSCLLVNPHVESGKLDTTYAMNSLLEAARPLDRLSFVPMHTTASKPQKLQRLATAVLQSAIRVADPAIIAEVHALSASLLAQFGGHPLVIPSYDPDVWNVSLASIVPAADIPPGTLVNADSLSSAGAVIRDSFFNFTTGAMRFKSSNSVIANNSVHSEGCRVQSGTTKCKTASLEISYLQSWFEGPTFIQNVTIKENFWFLGAGVNPLHADAMDTSGIVQSGDQFLAPLHG
jgi:hypothetical protein